MKLALTLLLALAAGPQDRDAEETLRGALASAKDSKKEVFLTFGTPSCGWCAKFEAWKREPIVAAVLGGEFVLVYVDIAKTPGGKDLHEKYSRARASGVPWFVILDSDRNELADSSGPKGNIGCPDSDEEIDLFLGILKKVSRTLKDNHLEALKMTLLANRKK